MKKATICDVTLTVLKLLLPVLLLLPLAFFSYRLIEGRLFDVAHLGEESYHSGTGLYFFASALLLLGVNLFCTVLGIVGWVIAYRHKTSPRRRENLITFRILTASPALCQILYGLILIASHAWIG